MHILQSTFCVGFLSLPVLARVSPALLRATMNTTVNDEYRHPPFTENILRGRDRAQAISGSSSPISLVEVRNRTPPGSQGSTSLNDFRMISIDLIITEGPLVPYGSQCVTVHGSAGSWGAWGTGLSDFHDVDAAIESRAFEWDQIVMDEDEAYHILSTRGIMGPWVCIYLCKMPATGLLFYVFQQQRGMGSLETVYLFVGVEDGRVRLFQGAVQHPCILSLLDLTMNVTFQAQPANRTKLQVSPSGLTNVTSQKAFEVEGVLSESVTAF